MADQSSLESAALLLLAAPAVYCGAYVDDLGFAIVDDLLFDHRGEPLIFIEYGSDGVASRRQRSRAELYYDVPCTKQPSASPSTSATWRR